MKKFFIIKLRDELHSKFGVFMHSSLKHRCLYNDFVSPDCSMRIREFLSINYSDVNYFHFSDCSCFIEF